ncbi:MAG: hypothetical protein LUO87_03145 [Methanomicrobiales archaeon]|nr:hypothetical protein [Methanomicrobiales archaeon]
MVVSVPLRTLAVLALAISLALCAGCATSPAPQEVVPTTTPATSGPAVTATATTPPAASTVVYVSSSYGYTLTYPAAWSVREENGGATVIFTTPAESSSDSFRENLKVTVQDLSSSPMNLDAFITSQLEARKQGLANYNPTHEENLRIGGYNARKLSYTGTLGSGLMRWVEIYTIRGLTAYTLSFTSEESHYRFYVENLDKTLKSFTFT